MPIGFTRLQGFGNRFTSSPTTGKKAGPDLLVAKGDKACFTGNQPSDSPQCKPRFDVSNLLIAPFHLFLSRLSRLYLPLSSWLGSTLSLQQKHAPLSAPINITTHLPVSVTLTDTDTASTSSDFKTPDQPDREPLQGATFNQPQLREVEKKHDNPLTLSNPHQPPLPNQVAFKLSGQHLWESALAGDTGTVRRFIKLGMNVNTGWGKYQRTPLQETIIQNNPAMVKALLEAKHIDVNLSDRLGFRAIDLAVISNHPDIVKALLAKGANLEAQTHELPLTNSPLYLAVLLGNRDMVQLLLQHQANVNGQSLFQDTPLHCAVTCRRQDIVEDLLAHGADIRLRNQYGQMPLHRAASSGDPKILALLLAQKNAEPNAPDELGRSPLHYAALNDNLQAVKLLKSHHANFDLTDRNGETPRDILMKRRKISEGGGKLPPLKPTLWNQPEFVTPVSS